MINWPTRLTDRPKMIPETKLYIYLFCLFCRSRQDVRILTYASRCNQPFFPTSSPAMLSILKMRLSTPCECFWPSPDYAGLLWASQILSVRSPRACLCKAGALAVTTGSHFSVSDCKDCGWAGCVLEWMLIISGTDINADQLLTRASIFTDC